MTSHSAASCAQAVAGAPVFDSFALRGPRSSSSDLAAFEPLPGGGVRSRFALLSWTGPSGAGAIGVGGGSSTVDGSAAVVLACFGAPPSAAGASTGAEREPAAASVAAVCFLAVSYSSWMAASVLTRLRMATTPDSTSSFLQDAIDGSEGSTNILSRSFRIASTHCSMSTGDAGSSSRTRNSCSLLIRCISSRRS